MTETCADPDGRYICAEVKLDSDATYSILGVYAPAIDNQEEKCRFLDQVRELMLCYGSHRTILTGDFNIKLSALDTDNPRYKTREPQIS